MTTTRAEFIDLADELIGDEFADFAVASTIVKTTGWNDATQTATTISSDVFTLIPIDNKSSQFERQNIKSGNLGQNIQIGDLVVIGERQKITREESLFHFGLDNSHVVYGGIDYTIVDIYLDPAEASIQMQLRRK